MLAREQAELAAWACLYARPLIERSRSLCPDALSEYWIASRCRLDHWGSALRRLGDGRSPTADRSHGTLQQLVEEVAVAEILTRAVAAITYAHDTFHHRDEASPIGRNTLTAHSDTRRRLMTLLSSKWKSDSEKWLEARQLMRSADKWSDALLAHVGEADVVAKVACEPERVREFAIDARLHEASTTNSALLVYSLRSSLSTTEEPALNAEINHRIAGAALGLFGPEAFDSLGMALPAWMIRAERSTEEAMTMIDRLFGEDFQHGPTESSDRWRWAT